MTRYALTIEENLCWGCRTCEVACKQENRPSDGVKLIDVREDGPKVAAGRLDFSYKVIRCRHCDEPPCIDACPADAITRRSDGIVVLDSGSCTGCGACLGACPYHAIALDAKQGVAQKCNLCHHRVDKGLMPACADSVCPGHCIRFNGPPGDQPEPMGLRPARTSGKVFR
jgi:Fe-S-cluster-containing dehydrogenase component